MAKEFPGPEFLGCWQQRVGVRKEGCRRGFCLVPWELGQQGRRDYSRWSCYKAGDKTWELELEVGRKMKITYLTSWPAKPGSFREETVLGVVRWNNRMRWERCNKKKLRNKLYTEKRKNFFQNMSAIKKLPFLARWSTVSLGRMLHQKSEDMHTFQKLISVKSVKISWSLLYLHSKLISLICTQEASHHLSSHTLPGSL